MSTKKKKTLREILAGFHDPREAIQINVNIQFSFHDKLELTEKEKYGMIDFVTTVMKHFGRKSSTDYCGVIDDYRSGVIKDLPPFRG